MKKKLGFIVNPYAGIGGRVGLKGSDGKEIVEKALSLGAEMEAPQRSLRCLKQLLAIKDQIFLITCTGDMGENQAEELGFEYEVITKPKKDRTTGKDTEKAAKIMMKKSVDLIIFAGGDGTARDIFRAVDRNIPVVGIPAGVKIHSGVYGATPESAGQVVKKLFENRGKVQYKEAEVMDIDEEAFRNNQVSAKLYGYMKIPFEKTLMQSKKAGSNASEENAVDGMASHIIENMEEDRLYLFGPGTTTRGILKKLDIDKTLLGVDAVLNKKLLAKDLMEKDILELLKDYPKAAIVVTVIGGQGFIFGRGNQQLSHRVIKKVGHKNITVAAIESKMIALEGKPLRADTGDKEIDDLFNGYMKVLTGLGRYHAVKVVG